MRISELFESFDSAVQYTRHYQNDTTVYYTFEFDDLLYRVEFIMGESVQQWHIQYGILNTRIDNIDLVPTNNSSGALTVLSTVIATIKDFIRNNDNVCELQFEGKKSDKLASLYDAMMKALSNKLNFEYESSKRGEYIDYTMWLNNKTKYNEEKEIVIPDHMEKDLRQELKPRRKRKPKLTVLDEGQITSKSIVAAINNKYITMHKGAGYWYFIYDDGVKYDTHSVFVMKLKDMSFDAWVQEGKDFVNNI